MKKLVQIREKLTPEKVKQLKLELSNTRLNYELDEALNSLIVYGQANEVRLAQVILVQCGLSVL